MLILVPAVLSYAQGLAVQNLTEQETRANVALTQVFANNIWPGYADFVERSRWLAPATLRQRIEVAALRADVAAQLEGLSVVKLKLFNLDGVTVFSTEPEDIGKQKIAHQAFERARAGGVASDIGLRDHIKAPGGDLQDRHVVYSYVPIRHRDTAEVMAVLELYSDVTALMQEIESTQWQLALGVSAALVLPYLAFTLVLCWAARRMRASEQARQVEAERFHHQAYHDPLTALPNRASFNERLAEATARARRNHTPFAVLFLDLDRFKLVNDSLGHEAGDELLRTVTARMETTLRDGDRLFRVGGDEFTIILFQLDKPEDAANVARRLLEVLGEPITLLGREVSVGASIGIALYPDDAHAPDALVKAADGAMYQAKQRGRERFEFYSAEINTRALERFELDSALQRALRLGEFTLHYQPRVRASDRRTVGVEALLRWRHPERGLLAPGHFIDFLEETRRIVPVGSWVLEAACAQAARWQDEGLGHLRMSVNIAAQQFESEDFVDLVRDVLDRTGLAPERLELELTERTLIAQTPELIARVETLRVLGVRISIDDFGAGYSSISYLKRFPIDYLKIDRTLIRDLPHDTDDCAIVEAVAAMARTLGMQLVAEGVEQPEQVEWLTALGCMELQGFLFARPMPPEQFAQLAAKRAS
jgi:diguanylate cyclase (GGDEF)-like protein